MELQLSIPQPPTSLLLLSAQTRTKLPSQRRSGLNPIRKPTHLVAHLSNRNVRVVLEVRASLGPGNHALKDLFSEY